MRELIKCSTDPLIIKHGESKYEEFISLVLAEYRKSLARDKRHLVRQYRAVDIARKVVGVGSVGTRAWIVVLEGSSSNDVLVLQIKEAQRSVLERYAGKAPFLQHGQRVVEGQRAMQTASDIFLGWTRAVGLDGKVHDFYVRQLWDGKGSFDLNAIDAEGLTALGKICGWTLAHAHARTGNRFAIAGYLGKATLSTVQSFHLRKNTPNKMNGISRNSWKPIEAECCVRKWMHSHENYFDESLSDWLSGRSLI